ncbi:MAG: prepilin peptidase [Roseburia sp.]|nr:prepilin peptidase [Roseburia sp.]MCM1278063.1 prepilin peptidase [Robinsoniella sp.]
MTIELYNLIFYIWIFLFGIVIGSFLNVCILRIPNRESIAKNRSHCMQCGYQLKWYDLIPLFSYLFLGGRCRQCKKHISLQYPIIEGVNGLLYVLIFVVKGWNLDAVIYCFLASALLTLSVIDFRTYEIPFGINVFIFILGILHLLLHISDWKQYLIGLVLVSGIFEIIFLASKGRAIGGGDVKLMAAAGLLIGWKLSYLAMIAGCVIGSVIHLIRMKVTKEGHKLAMGPYLAIGILLSVLWGESFLSWYFGLF